MLFPRFTSIIRPIHFKISKTTRKHRCKTMKQDFLRRMEKMANAFSKGQRAIAKYISEHYDKAAFMTAAKLGTTVGVSESTVVRFATEIGFSGYPQLQRAMQEMIRNRLTSVQRIEIASDRLGDGDILDRVLSLDIEKIRKTIEETSHEEFIGAVDDLVAARKIYILGGRSAGGLATFMGFYFKLIFNHVEIITATSETEMFEALFRVSSEDVVVGISFPRYSTRAINAVEFASLKQAKVIAITDSADSPLAKHCTRLLLARSDMISIADSLVAPLSLINALIAATAMRKKDEVSRVFDELELFWARSDVYERADKETDESE